MRPSTQGTGERLSSAVGMVLLAALTLLCTDQARAGGSGLNVLIVANQASSNSLELANYYRVQRSVPAEQVLRVHWPGGNVQWTHQQFTNTLLNPVRNFVTQNGLSNQIQYVVLSMDFPYRITGGQDNSTTAALFYGFKGSPANLDSSYALSESRFESAPPVASGSDSFLTMMLTADSLEEAKGIVDQGVSGDGSFPDQHAWLIKSSDSDRNKRYTAFDNAIFNARLCDRYCLLRTNDYSAPGWTNLLGCQLGLKNFTLVSNAFVPGSVGDSMTSFGGRIFENPGQTTLLEFIRAGASGSYGTVTEPQNLTIKFPDPMVYFYQGRGFSLAECYFQSVRQPYQGLFVGEPLSAPWKRSASGAWYGLEAGAQLCGTTNLSLAFTEHPSGAVLDRLDLFVDGRRWQTLTNCGPRAGNRLSVSLDGYTISYEVPTNASIESIAAGLAAELNLPAHTNLTQVTATPVGDRIELQSAAAPLPEGVFQLVDEEADLSATNFYLAAPTGISSASKFSAGAWTEAGLFGFTFETMPGVSNVLQASTNLADWVTLLTNASGGPINFVDPDAALYPLRFYRVATAPPKPTPQLQALGLDDSNRFLVDINGPADRPYFLQSSQDFAHWTDVFTNLSGGDALFSEPATDPAARRFYRTRSGDTSDYAPITTVGQTPSGGNILQVDDIFPGSIVVWASTNGTHWRPIYTSSQTHGIQTVAGSAAGGAEPLTTHLRAAQPEFLESTAQGVRQVAVELDIFGGQPLDNDSHLDLAVTKTNGTMVTLSVTNPAGNLVLETFMTAFVDAVNTEADLLTADGLEAGDLMERFPGEFVINLRARAGGQRAARIEFQLTGSPELAITPGGTRRLDENTGDLNPRNHLYVSAGGTSLAHNAQFDTTQLADGHHVLTAVAYEGTHVHSQTLLSTPVIISNSPLQATLTLPNGGTTRPLDEPFELEVSANTNAVDTILLFSTGGFYAGKTNQQNVSFTITGTDLGAGEHSFHAVTTTTNGPAYRTAPLNITLTH